jgi:hypothetical protein
MLFPALYPDAPEQADEREEDEISHNEQSHSSMIRAASAREPNQC